MMFLMAQSHLKTLYFFILFFSINSSFDQLCNYCHCLNETAILNCSMKIFSMENCTDIIHWKIVDFSLRNLETFDSNQLCSIRTQRLILKSNSIENISNSTFDSLNHILVELDLDNNQLSFVSSTWLNSKLDYLEKLNLASNRIESLIDLNDIRLGNLKELNLSRNIIESFPSEIRQWTSLTTLDLSFNQLSSVPRFALMGLNNLTWLSFASNRNLSCLIQDSFKYLKSLIYLDLSSTNLHNLDACLFVQLISLQTLQIDNISMNCTSCWLLIARENALQITGQCHSNDTIQQISTLTNDHLKQTCSKTSIDCSKDYCEPGRMSADEQSLIHFQNKISSLFQTSTILFIVGMILLSILITFLAGFYRWKKKKKIFCCHFPSQKTTIAEATRRRREHHKQIINHNPVVIESVVTHGANMNVPSYPYQNCAYINDETSKNKRKLYNPMFADSPTTSDIRRIQTNDDTSSSNNDFYSEHL